MGIPFDNHEQQRPLHFQMLDLKGSTSRCSGPSLNHSVSGKDQIRTRNKKTSTRKENVEHKAF